MKKRYITAEELKEIEELKKKFNFQESKTIPNVDIQKIVSKSIGQTKYCKKRIAATKKLSLKYFYQRILPVIISSSIAITMGTNTLRSISDNNKVNESMPSIIECAKENLKETKIIITDDNNNFRINTILIKNNYQNITINEPTISEAYAYRICLQQNKISDIEANYIASLMTYDNGKHRYKDWHDFYTINGLLTEEGNPSIAIFYEKSKEEILQAYNEGNINNIVKEIDITTNSKSK